MNVIIEMKTPVAYSSEQETSRIRIYGSFFGDQNVFDVKMLIHDPHGVDIDGDYLLIHEDMKTGGFTLVRGGYETFPVYLVVKEQAVTVSDDLFGLLRSQEKVSWNLDAVNDYFSPGWNNSQKGSKTPFNEISKFEAGHYMRIEPSESHFTGTHKWRMFKPNSKFAYGLNNLAEFKADFLELLDEYIHKLSGEEVAFSVSGGIDSGALAVTASLRLPKKNLRFYTIYYGGAEDESSLAKKLDPFLSAPVDVVNVTLPKSFIDQLRNLIVITQSPYSDIEGLTHLKYFEELKNRGCTKLVLGLGADLTFGGTPYEYPALTRDLLFAGKYKDAYRVFMAYLSGSGQSKHGFNDSLMFIKHAAIAYAKNLLPYSVYCLVRLFLAKKTNVQDQYLNVSLVRQDAVCSLGYRDALSRAYGDSALRQLSQILRSLAIDPVYPFEGKKFADLARKCDPLIFARNQNKYCLRYSLADRLPKEILGNKKKFGNGGFQDELFIKHKDEILSYVKESIEKEQNSIVNKNRLKSALEQDVFTDNVFRSLNIMIFEDVVFGQGVDLISPDTFV